MRKLEGLRIQEKKEKITIVQVIEEEKNIIKRMRMVFVFSLMLVKWMALVKDLIDFISETANIKRSSLGTIKIQKNCAFFEVDKKQSKNIASCFKGIYVDGRELRVNRDS